MLNMIQANNDIWKRVSHSLKKRVSNSLTRYGEDMNPYFMFYVSIAWHFIVNKHNNHVPK